MILQKGGRMLKITMITWQLMCIYFPALSISPWMVMIHINLVMSLSSYNMNLMLQTK